LAKKKNKFDKIEVNENYIAPDEQGKTQVFSDAEEEESVEDETVEESYETPAEKYHDRKVSKTGVGVFSFKKAHTAEKKEKVRISMPEGFIKPHILMLCVLVLGILGMLVADSSFYSEFSGVSLYCAYAATYVVIYILPCIIYAMTMKKRPSQINVRGFEFSQGSFVLVSLVLLLCLTSLLKYYIAYTFAYRTTDTVPENMSVLGAVVVTAIIPAICEEFFVHGVLQSEYSRFGGGVSGILVSAFVFSLIHFDLQYFIIYLAAGLVLGVVTHMTGSVFPAMLMHLVNNLAAVFLSDTMTFIASERIGGAFVMIVLAIFAFVMLIIQLQMMEKTCRARAVKLASAEDAEACEKYMLFVCKDAGTAKRLVRLLFSPALIAAVILFAVVV
jgi:membrane protease YdiL (CAAX protease family)